MLKFGEIPSNHILASIPTYSIMCQKMAVHLPNYWPIKSQHLFTNSFHSCNFKAVDSMTAYQFQMCHIWLLIYPKTNHHLWNSISSPIPTTWYKWTFIINKLVEIHGVAFNEVRGLLITCRFNLQDWFICSSLHSSESKKGVVLIQEKKERNAHTWEKDIP